MWKLMLTGELVTGFSQHQVIDNLVELLEASPEEVSEQLSAETPVEFKRVEDKAEADHWRRQFAEAGALLVVLPGDEDTPGGSRYAGADPASTQVEEPTIASVTARLDAVRRRNMAYMKIGGIAVLIGLVIVLGSWLFG